ncbi:MAG TPA: molybdopterin-dependent oxidoreductase [Anaerolineae bacterium]|nr:molybdopterin-dependent oxidoreductase [Anaerolineae bacterium]HOR00469.1 molybdopterin-dependent oxidoreductase [Anaerolineae bacterium]HPL30834.1 molybdopterin-dependent oxidoreductase [Anaerolineae bacterium]
MKRTTLGIILLATILCAGVLAGCGGGAPKVDWQLQVTGAVSKPLSISYGELAKMQQADLKDVLMEKSRGEDEVHSFSGVPLAGLLEQAGAGNVNTVTAVAGDGYAVEISKDELRDAIIALKQDGKWIANADKDHGPIRLVCPHTPANRWVFQLQEIQVQ